MCVRFLARVVLIVASGVASFAASIAAWGGAARAEGERALSASLGWATFSTPGKPVGKQAPPTLTPDIGGALAVSYEHSISTDVSLRGELAGGLFYGGAQAMQS